MAVTKTVNVETTNARASTTLTDTTPTVPLPDTPQGLMVIGPQVTLHFVKDAWNKANSYDYYDVVQVDGTSYIAVQDVPANTEITNTTYWAKWNDPNAQVELLQQTVSTFDARIKANATGIANIKTTYFKNDPVYYGADPTGVKDSTTAIQNCINANKGGTVVFTQGVYLVSAPILTPYPSAQRVSIDFSGSLIKAKGAPAQILYVGGQSISSSDNSVQFNGNVSPGFVKNATFYATSASTTLVRIAERYQTFYLTDCVLVGPGVCVQIADTATYSSDVNLERIAFYNATTTTAHAIIANSRDNTFKTIRSLSKHPVQIECHGYQLIDDAHLLGWSDNNTFIGITFDDSIKCNAYYADNLACGIKYNGGTGAPYIECFNGFMVCYSQMDSACYIDLSAGKNAPFMVVEGCDVDPTRVTKFTSVKMPTAAGSTAALKGVKNNIIRNMTNLNTIDAFNIRNVPNLWNLKQGAWTHVFYMIVESNQPVFLLAKPGYTQLIEVGYNGTDPHIYTTLLNGSNENVTYGAKVVNNPIGCGTAIEFSVNRTDMAAMIPFMVLDTQDTVVIGYPYLSNGLASTVTPTVTSK